MAGPESDRPAPKTGDGASKPEREKAADDAQQAHHSMLDDILEIPAIKSAVQGLGAGAVGRATADFLDGLDGKKDGVAHNPFAQDPKKWSDLLKEKHPINSKEDNLNAIDQESVKRISQYLRGVRLEEFNKSDKSSVEEIINPALKKLKVPDSDKVIDVNNMVFNDAIRRVSQYLRQAQSEEFERSYKPSVHEIIQPGLRKSPHFNEKDIKSEATRLVSQYLRNAESSKDKKPSKSGD